MIQTQKHPSEGYLGTLSGGHKIEACGSKSVNDQIWGPWKDIWYLLWKKLNFPWGSIAQYTCFDLSW